MDFPRKTLWILPSRRYGVICFFECCNVLTDEELQTTPLQPTTLALLQIYVHIPVHEDPPRYRIGSFPETGLSCLRCQTGDRLGIAQAVRRKPPDCRRSRCVCGANTGDTKANEARQMVTANQRAFSAGILMPVLAPRLSTIARSSYLSRIVHPTTERFVVNVGCLHTPCCTYPGMTN